MAKSSIRAQGALIRQHRMRLGLTQAQLAMRTGFGERVIRKAEAGEAVNRYTLEVLAVALSHPERQVSVSELSGEPLAVAQAFVNAYHRHGVEAARHCAPFMADDHLLVVHADSFDLPFAGSWRGVDGFDAMLRAAYALFEPVEERVDRWFCEGNRVGALRTEITRSRKHPDQQSVLQTWMFTDYVVDNGVITQQDMYLDALAWKRSIDWGGPSDTQSVDKGHDSPDD